MLFAVLLVAGFAAPVFAADPPVIPADPKPASKKTTAKKTATKPADSAATGVVPLPSPEPAVVSQKSVIIRGQASLNSEIVARLKKGDRVTVLEEITTKKRKDQPDKWYKISIPNETGVWVHSMFIDADKKVKANRLNLRSGPGENYSVLGRIEKGATVNVTEHKGEWSRIDPPAGSFAFVAAHLVSREPAGATTIAANTVPPVPVVIAPPPPVVIPPVTVVTAPPPVVAPPITVIAPPPTDNPPVLPPVVRALPPEEPLVKRVVTREGIVKSSVSVQAPTHFVLRGLDNNKTVNYLFSPSTNILIKDFKGQRVVVTGEESLDERWPNTPVIEIETIQAVE